MGATKSAGKERATQNKAARTASKRTAATLAEAERSIPTDDA